MADILLNQKLSWPLTLLFGLFWWVPLKRAMKK